MSLRKLARLRDTRMVPATGGGIEEEDDKAVAAAAAGGNRA